VLRQWNSFAADVSFQPGSIADVNRDLAAFLMPHAVAARLLERFPKRLNRDSLGGANMIQAAYWQEASMDGEAIFGGLA